MLQRQFQRSHRNAKAHERQRLARAIAGNVLSPGGRPPLLRRRQAGSVSVGAEGHYPGPEDRQSQYGGFASRLGGKAEQRSKGTEIRIAKAPATFRWRRLLHVTGRAAGAAESAVLKTSLALRGSSPLSVHQPATSGGLLAEAHDVAQPREYVKLTTEATTHSVEIDGEALARAFRNPRRFEKLVEILRRNGASDRAILAAMARS